MLFACARLALPILLAHIYGKSINQITNRRICCGNRRAYKEAVREVLEALVALAYKNAKNSFTLPGLGKLVLVNRKARMGRNPATGEQINIAAKRVVKFRVAKAAKDAILGTEVRDQLIVVVKAEEPPPPF